MAALASTARTTHTPTRANVPTGLPGKAVKVPSNWGDRTAVKRISAESPDILNQGRTCRGNTWMLVVLFQRRLPAHRIHVKMAAAASALLVDTSVNAQFASRVRTVKVRWNKSTEDCRYFIELSVVLQANLPTIFDNPLSPVSSSLPFLLIQSNGQLHFLWQNRLKVVMTNRLDSTRLWCREISESLVCQIFQSSELKCWTK